MYFLYLNPIIFPLTDLQTKLKGNESNSESLQSELEEVKSSLADVQRQLKASEDKLSLSEDGKAKLVSTLSISYSFSYCAMKDSKVCIAL